MSDPMAIQSHKGSYQVCFIDDALNQLNASVPDDFHFIIDANVANLYADRMRAILGSNSVLLIDACEQNKSLDVFPAYVAHLVANKIRKNHTICAIGGGVTQDIACFLASTMLRGVEWVFYPTTLLAQADSCIGSKSSINAGEAKNILGTFYPPRDILISSDFLRTLQDVDIRSGIGEMLKVHVIDGPGSFDAISAAYETLFVDNKAMKGYIDRSLHIKQVYIENDEFDTAQRRVFNYGHSFGHAIEAATDFAIPHGIAVTIGADMANFIAWCLQVGSEDHFMRMHPTLKKNYHGFEHIDIPLDRFFSAIGKDKKNTDNNALTLILPDQQGRVSIASYPNDDRFKDGCREYFSGYFHD